MGGSAPRTVEPPSQGLSGVPRPNLLFRGDSLTRPNWREYFLNVATAVSLRSDCRRSKVGAVLVDAAHRILSTGYVGVAVGQRGCLDGACPRGLLSYEELAAYTSYDNCISTHAEVNAWDYGNTLHYLGQPDLTMYVTRAPCDDCRGYILKGNPLVHFVYPTEF